MYLSSAHAYFLQIFFNEIDTDKNTKSTKHNDTLFDVLSFKNKYVFQILTLMIAHLIDFVKLKLLCAVILAGHSCLNH